MGEARSLLSLGKDFAQSRSGKTKVLVGTMSGRTGIQPGQGVMKLGYTRSGRHQSGGLAALPAVSHTTDKSDYVSVGRYPFVLRLATPGDLDVIRGLVREAAEWLRASKNTDQWAKPWPDRAGQRERILNDLLKGKTWLVWDGPTAVATITVDTDGPLDANDKPVWPGHKSREPALYVRRVIVSRKHAGRGLGAALLDWAATTANREHKTTLIRIDVWTTNRDLHAYYERHHFTRCESSDPRELSNYPSQALFERQVDRPRSDYTELFIEEDSHDEHRFR
jgi:GNAT superfamily N-acetyltransferase